MNWSNRKKQFIKIKDTTLYATKYDFWNVTF
jgi:hypothetical protein